MSEKISRSDAELQSIAKAALGLPGSDNGPYAKANQYRLTSLFVTTAVIASILAAVVACKNSYEIQGAIGQFLISLFLGLFVAVSSALLFWRPLRRSVCLVIIVGYWL
jgi:hypothetical protein